MRINKTNNANVNRALAVLAVEAESIKRENPTATKTSIALRITNSSRSPAYSMVALLLNEIEI